MSASVAHAQCADPFAMNMPLGAAPFTQTRHLSGVRAPLVSRGVATTSAERVDWRVREPIDILTRVTRAEITQSVEGGAPQRIGPQGGGDAFLSSAGLFDLLVGDLDSLNAHYQVTRGAPAANGAWSLSLAPRAAQLSRFVSRIEVVGCDRVERVEVRQANGDWMEIVLGPVGS